jgi:hypothetical protein
MHRSLKPATNRILIAVYAVGVAVLFAASPNTAFLTCTLGALFGVPAGFLQAHALKTQAAAFSQTVTALDVRRVMMSSPQGKWAIRLSWVCAVLVFALAMIFRAPVAVLASWLAGYLAFMLVRDAIAYRSLRFVREC